MNTKYKIIIVILIVIVSITSCTTSENQFENAQSSEFSLEDIDPGVLADLKVDAETFTDRELTLLGNSNDVPLRDFMLPDFDGNNHSLSDYYGQVIILNFWAIGCPPCVKEMPDFNRVGNKDGVVLVTVAQKNVLGNEQQASREFIDDFDSVALWDEKLETQSLYPSQYYPHTYIIDRSGIIRFVLNSASYELLNELVSFCDEKFN